MANDFVIIESQSSNSGHVMDNVWRNLLIGMGHTATILPQTALDNLGSISSYDVLIVSSGVVTLPAGRVTTIRQFMQTGKSVYLQGEYLPTFSANVAMQTIVNATGGTYTTGATVSGQLAPTTILNAYATTPNSVPSLGYHWYGATATGCNNLEYFMRYNGSNIGFVYCPTTGAYGDVIQSTDQDWVNQSQSLPLMQNIVYYLLSGNACTVVCGVLAEATTLDLRAIPREEGGVQLEWSLDGDALPGTFHVLCNGKEVGTVETGDSHELQFTWLDQRLLAGHLHYKVRHTDRNGAETLQGSVSIDLGEQPALLRVAATSGGFRLRLSEGHDLQALSLVSLGGIALAVPVENIHSADGLLVPMHSMAPGVYLFQGLTVQGQAVHASAVWLP